MITSPNVFPEVRLACENVEKFSKIPGTVKTDRTCQFLQCTYFQDDLTKKKIFSDSR